MEHILSESPVGRKVGHYELQEIIGRGGMAVVYRAAQPRIDRDVAIKIIAAPYARHPEFVSRFEQEMRATVRLQHPHILPVYDVSLEGDDLYMVMAYLPGGTLSRRVAASPDGLPLTDAICITSQVASALDYAHAQGIVHRDVKPGNIMLDAHGNAYLGDFGIAQVAETETQPPLGTFAYMAPELLAGEKATPASDIYSLGVVAFEMLAGQRPYEAHDRASLLELRAKIGIPDILDLRPDLPPGMQVVLTQALAEDPAGRPPHASSLAGALHRASGLTGLPCAENGGAAGKGRDIDEDEETGESLAAPLIPVRLPLDAGDDDLDEFDDLDEYDGYDGFDEPLELDDHPLVRTPLPFADLSWSPGEASTEPSQPVVGLTRLESPRTQVAKPAVAAPGFRGPRSVARTSFGPLLLLIWLGVILALLGLAVLSVVLISHPG